MNIACDKGEGSRRFNYSYNLKFGRDGGEREGGWVGGGGWKRRFRAAAISDEEMAAWKWALIVRG